MGGNLRHSTQKPFASGLIYESAPCDMLADVTRASRKYLRLNDRIAARKRKQQTGLHGGGYQTLVHARVANAASQYFKCRLRMMSSAHAKLLTAEEPQRRA